MESLLAQARGQAQQQGGQQEQQDPGKLLDLTSSFLEKKNCYARNESSAYPMTNLFIGDTRLGCKSDADEQLILHIAFNQTVKVQSIQLVGFNRNQDPSCNPKTIKLFVNCDSMGFEDCEDLEATQMLELTEEDLDEQTSKPIPLKYVKFQRVSSITVFVEDNYGGDITELGMLKFFGRLVAGTNMNDFKSRQ